MRTVSEALAYVNAQTRTGERFPVGWCKRKTREAYLIPSDGTSTAAEAWRRTRHRFTGRWIRGGFIYWTGGADGDGHVAIMALRKGRIRSVDYPRHGHWNKTTVAALEAAWPDLVFAGTALDIDGAQVRKLPRMIRPWRHP